MITPSSLANSQACTGVTFAPLPAAMKASVASKLGEVAAEWAKGLDGRGKKGSEVLKEFQGLLKAAGG